VDALEALSRRYSWYRLGAVVLGGGAVWAASTYLETPWGWVALLGALGAFSAVALSHRRVDSWVEKFKIWAQIQAEQLARLNLDWERVPTPVLPAERVREPLEIDLDLTGWRSLHQLLDATISAEGSQRLAEWLSQEVPDLEATRQRQKIVRELVPLRRFRNRLLLAFRLVSKEQMQGDKLLRWLGVDYPSGRMGWALPVAALLAATNVTLFALSTFRGWPAYWMISVPLYLTFYFINIKPIEAFLGALVQLDRELDKFRTILRYLEIYPYREGSHLVSLCAPFRDANRSPSSRLRRIKIATAGAGLRMNPVMSLVLNLVLPWDFFFAYLAERYRAEMVRSLPVWLDVWHQLEALISLAGFAAINPEYTFPQIEPDAPEVLQAEGLGHPLLPPKQKVCNDFCVEELGELVVITGSNMAGKSTFIKTIGINLCLAYAGGPVNARSLRFRPFRLHTCIQVSDSIADGFSYFYAEVKCLKRLLERLESKDGLPLLYLIDEIFRGTNNRERLIGSRAYVQALIGARGVGVLATHDLELASLEQISSRVSNFHFRDHVEDGKLVFDYTLRPGPSPTTNALKIMRMEGLPVEGAPEPGEG
jgi:hypothetical protein